MKFSIKKIGVILILVFIYNYLWWHLNGTYLGRSIPDILLYMNGSGMQGYNSISSYCTYYCLIYLTLINIWIPKENVIFLTRMKKRIVFIRKRNMEIFICSAIFSGIIVLVNIVMTSGVLDYSYLVENNFYSACIFAYVGLLIFYWWVGLLFQIFIDISKKNVIAIVITVMTICLIYFFGKRYSLLWTPVKDLNIYEMVISSRSNMLDLLIIYVKQIVIVTACYITSKIVFLEKDIYENEK